MSYLGTILGHDFAYAAGRTALLQQSLLTESDVNRLLGASSFADVCAILTELSFTDRIDQGLQDPTEICRAVLTWVQDEVQTLAPKQKQDCFDIVWLPIISATISLHLKSQHGFVQAEYTMPTFLPEKRAQDLLKGLEQETYQRLPYAEQYLLQSVPKNCASPEDIDMHLAKAGGILRTELAARSNSKNVQQFVQTSIDLENIQAKLRLQESFTQEHFVTGGSLPLYAFLKTIEDMYNAIDSSELPYTFGNALKQHSNQIDIEQAFNTVLQSAIAKLWNTPLTIDPIIAFAIVGFEQVKLVRAIAIAKQNELSPQEIKSIVPPFLPATAFA